MTNKIARAKRRKIRTRAKVAGTAEKPRLSVFRSNTSVYVQIIDDVSGKTLLGLSDKHITASEKMPKTEKAKALGMLAAKKAGEQKITSVVFDRGSYAFHGRVKAVAEGAREGGLQF